MACEVAAIWREAFTNARTEKEELKEMMREMVAAQKGEIESAIKEAVAKEIRGTGTPVAGSQGAARAALLYANALRIGFLFIRRALGIYNKEVAILPRAI